MSFINSELTKYCLNGLVATGVHYGVLVLNLFFFEMTSAGSANFLAAICGITASFLGSRYYVFKKQSSDILNQALKFTGLYCIIAVSHGLILWAWTDLKGMDFRIGFLIATILQVSVTYIGNKRFVFQTP